MKRSLTFHSFLPYIAVVVLAIVALVIGYQFFWRNPDRPTSPNTQQRQIQQRQIQNQAFDLHAVMNSLSQVGNISYERTVATTENLSAILSVSNVFSNIRQKVTSNDNWKQLTEKMSSLQSDSTAICNSLSVHSCLAFIRTLYLAAQLRTNTLLEQARNMHSATWETDRTVSSASYPQLDSLSQVAYNDNWKQLTEKMSSLQSDSITICNSLSVHSCLAPIIILYLAAQSHTDILLELARNMHSATLKTYRTVSRASCQQLDSLSQVGRSSCERVLATIKNFSAILSISNVFSNIRQKVAYDDNWKQLINTMSSPQSDSIAICLAPILLYLAAQLEIMPATIPVGTTPNNTLIQQLYGEYCPVVSAIDEEHILLPECSEMYPEPVLPLEENLDNHRTWWQWVHLIAGPKTAMDQTTLSKEIPQSGAEVPLPCPDWPYLPQLGQASSLVPSYQVLPN